MLSMIIVVIVTHLTGQLVQVAKRLSKALFQDWQSESSPHRFVHLFLCSTDIRQNGSSKLNGLKIKFTISNVMQAYNLKQRSSTQKHTVQLAFVKVHI